MAEGALCGEYGSDIVDWVPAVVFAGWAFRVSVLRHDTNFGDMGKTEFCKCSICSTGHGVARWNSCGEYLGYRIDVFERLWSGYGIERLPNGL